MNNVENPWLWGEQKKLIAEAFTAWWKPRIIPWIRTYNLQQLPPSDRPKWLSAKHKAQLIAAMNLELGQHSAAARGMLVRGPSAAPSLQPRRALTFHGWHFSCDDILPCSPYCCHNSFEFPLGDGWSMVYLLIFSSYWTGIVTDASQEEHFMPFSELLAGWQQGDWEKYMGDSLRVGAYKWNHFKKNSSKQKKLG